MCKNRFNNKIITVFLVFGMILSCTPKKWQVDLKPNDSRPVVSIEIGDMEEARILEQEMKLEILRIDQNRLYFFEPKANIMDSIKAIGYTPQKADKMKMYYRIVKIPKDSSITKQELVKKHGVQFINEEKGYYIFRGDLSQLKNLKKQRIKLSELSEEVKPRMISIYVPEKTDIQKVSELHVDIFNTELLADSTYVIHGQAFDYQIEAMRTMNYTVKVQPLKIQ
jgi:hypothetical protein